MTEPRRLQLPDFCAPRAVLTVLLIVALTAVLLTLSDRGFGAAFWTALARTGLFLVWTGLTGAALLCAARGIIARYSAAQGACIVLGMMAVLVVLISEVAYRIMSSSLLNPDGLLGPIPVDRRLFLARNLLIGLLVAALALRYFYVAQQWRLNIESQADRKSTRLNSSH